MTMLPYGAPTAMHSDPRVPATSALELKTGSARTGA